MIDCELIGETKEFINSTLYIFQNICIKKFWKTDKCYRDSQEE